MKWDKDADQALSKVPFFVRKRVRARVEKEARDAGKNRVTLADVKATRERFLKKMHTEVKGYQVDACFGADGCPNRIMENDLPKKIEAILESEDLPGFLARKLGKDLKLHHEFRVTVSDCPNACSQPQIKDIGVIGAQLPKITKNDCIFCEKCVDTCKEGAITLAPHASGPAIDFSLCVKCGQCIRACPTQTLDTEKSGFRVLLGGKLGRHPRLAEELPGIYSEEETLSIIRRCVAWYKANSQAGERFGDLLVRDRTLILAPLPYS